MKTIFYSFATLIRKILFSSLEDKIHIFAPPCIDSMQKAVNDVNIFTSEAMKFKTGVEICRNYANVYLILRMINLLRPYTFRHRLI